MWSVPEFQNHSRPSPFSLYVQASCLIVSVMSQQPFTFSAYSTFAQPIHIEVLRSVSALSAFWIEAQCKTASQNRAHLSYISLKDQVMKTACLILRGRGRLEMVMWIWIGTMFGTLNQPNVISGPPGKIWNKNKKIRYEIFKDNQNLKS